MHIFQKNILDLLRKSSSLRYSELQPDDVESSHFKYHLNQLIKDGLVGQTGRGVYVLSPKGMTAVDRLSRGKVNPDITPKVITYSLLKDSRNYYLQRKNKEPYLGLVNMVGGKVHVGESAEDASIREVYEKTGYYLSETKLSGMAEIKIERDNTLISHVVAYIFVATIIYNELVQKNLVKTSLSSISIQKDLAPDLLPIINNIEISTSLFAINLDLTW